VLADFNEVPYIDSTGIGFIVGVYTSVTNMPGGRFVLVGPSHRVREVLDLMRLSTIIPIAADEASGLAFLTAEGSAARSAERE
jgi:anti-anti-sigma factor